MNKTGGRKSGVRLAAIILAVALFTPGASWSQGVRPGSRVQDSPQQADKSFLLEQQKKERPHIKSRKKQSQPSTKGKKPAKRTHQPADQPMRSGPVNPAGK